jgi:hypothetical protein
VLSNCLLYYCLLYYPENLDAFPLNFSSIATAQVNDAAVQAMLQLDCYAIQYVQAMLQLDCYAIQEFYGSLLVCRHDDNVQWRIVLPEMLIDPAINWYHYVLGHVGTARLCQTLRTHFWIRRLQECVEQVVLCCNSCQ